MLNGELVGTRALSGEIQREVISGGGGTTNYENLRNKPQINGVELEGNKTDAELGLSSIKYVNDKFNGASKPITYDTYAEMITALNSNGTNLNRGQDIFIVQIGIPDVWVAYIEETSVPYTYVDDDTFVNELLTNGTIQVGHYKLGYLETQKVDLSGYLEKPKLPTRNSVVTITSDGIVNATNLVHERAAPWTVPLRDNDGCIKVAEPVADGDAVPKSYTDEHYVEKLEGDGTGEPYYGFVYGIDNATGKTIKVPYGHQPYGPAWTGGLVKRNNKQIKVPLEPVSDNDAISKQYVDKYAKPLNGTEAPTTSTVATFEGQLYIDTTNNNTYQCIEIDTTNKVYTWVKLIKETDYASDGNRLGVVSLNSIFGITSFNNTLYKNALAIQPATEAIIAKKTDMYKPITPYFHDYAVKVGITTNTHTLTKEEQAKAQSWLGVDKLFIDEGDNLLKVNPVTIQGGTTDPDGSVGSYYMVDSDGNPYSIGLEIGAEYILTLEIDDVVSEHKVVALDASEAFEGSVILGIGEISSKDYNDISLLVLDNATSNSSMIQVSRPVAQPFEIPTIIVRSIREKGTSKYYTKEETQAYVQEQIGDINTALEGILGV